MNLLYRLCKKYIRHHDKIEHDKSLCNCGGEIGSIAHGVNGCYKCGKVVSGHEHVKYFDVKAGHYELDIRSNPNIVLRNKEYILD